MSNGSPIPRKTRLSPSAGRLRSVSEARSFGWLTMTLPKKPDWDEIAELITTSYCLIAPKTLARQVRPT